MKKNLLFITGTRADYGKIKPIIKELSKSSKYKISIFVSGMHTQIKYGSTYFAILRDFPKITEVYPNNSRGCDASSCCAEMIHGVNIYLKKNPIDLVIVHGDRVEALSACISASLNNILVAHLEGGEKSGTIDESIRHAISKFANYHFVCNNSASKVLTLMGEDRQTIFNIGSADMDYITKGNFPKKEESFKKYEIEFEKYGVVLFHPVTTDVKSTIDDCETMVRAIIHSGKNYIIIDPNNDLGSEEIRKIYSKNFKDKKRFRRFPSIDFEHFISLLNSSSLLIGNSSAGIRECPYLKISSINIGSRQAGRLGFKHSSIFNFNKNNELSLEDLITNIWDKRNYSEFKEFGEGNSALQFKEILNSKDFWKKNIQKKLSY